MPGAEPHPWLGLANLCECAPFAVRADFEPSQTGSLPSRKDCAKKPKLLLLAPRATTCSERQARPYGF